MSEEWLVKNVIMDCSFLLKVVKNDGNIVYQGYACECAPYFAKIGVPCPIWQNPSDFYIKKLSINYPKSKEDDE